MNKIIVSIVLFLLAGLPPALAGTVPTIDKDELKAMLDEPGLMLLDVRTGNDWSASEYKIKGAERLKEGEIASALKSYPKERTIVFYCA